MKHWQRLFWALIFSFYLWGILYPELYRVEDMIICEDEDGKDISIEIDSRLMEFWKEFIEE